jgi:hypothetical protein
MLGRCILDPKSPVKNGEKNWSKSVATKTKAGAAVAVSVDGLIGVETELKLELIVA